MPKLARNEDLAALTPGELAAACQAALNLPENSRQDRLLVLLQRWAELDGAGAMHWGRDHLLKKREWPICFQKLGLVWASCDRASLLAWWEAEGHTGVWAPQATSLAYSILSWLVPYDPVLGARFLLTLAKPLYAMKETLGHSLRHASEARQIADLLKNQPQPTLKLIEKGHFSRPYEYDHSAVGLVLAALDETWPSLDRPGYESWAKQQPLGSDGKNRLAQMALVDFSKAPSAEAADALISLENPILRAQMKCDVLMAWFKAQPKDTSAVGAWLDRVRHEPDSVPALGLYAEICREEAPEAGFAWLESIPDQQARETAVMRYFSNWLRLDRPAALKYLETENVEKSRKERLSVLAGKL